MVAVRSACSLCGQHISVPVHGEDGALFCCHACKEVTVLLAEAPAPGAKSTLAGTSGEVTFEIGGLWCASCAWLVEERLKRTPGVTSARVSFLERRARIAYDSSRTNPRSLRNKIRSTGYRAGTSGELDEEDRFFTRMLIGGLLAMHIMVVSLIIYARNWLGLSSPEAAWLEHFFYLMQFVLSIPLVLILGLPILRAGLNSLLRGLPNIQTLVAIGALAALGISSRNLFSENGHVYFDTAAMLFFLLTVGRWLEMRAHQSGRSAFEALAETLPRTARRVLAEGDENVPLEDIRPGQRVRVLPGERIPADGIVALGEGEVDESLLTGEPRPILRRPHDPVLGGAFNLDGAFEIILTRTSAESRVGQIQSVLEELLWQRSPAEQLADRFAARMVYAAMAIAGLTFFAWLALADRETALLNSLSVLLIACPCALGIATPLTLWQAVGRALENGVLVRSSALFEKLAGIQEVFFDKTGTLTRLPHHVTAVAVHGTSELELRLRITALEKFSSHPFAEAILEAWGGQTALLPAVTAFRVVPGAGMVGIIQDDAVQVGSRSFMQSNGLELPPPLDQQAQSYEQAGGSVVFAGWTGQVRGLVVIGEQLRADVRPMLDALQVKKLSPAILTGDSLAAGKRWQTALGIPVLAGLQPEDKLDIIARVDRSAMMVGDGINDGPALAAARVGVAMLRGADVARSAAEVTLVEDDLRALPWLFDLAAETRRRLRQNLAWAVAYNVVGIGLAVAGQLQPALAALAMVLSSSLVTRNALQLRRFPAWNVNRASSGRIQPVPDSKSAATAAPQETI